MKIKRIVLHHSASSRDKTTLKDIDNWHRLRWPHFKGSMGYWVGYHVVIGKDWMKQTRDLGTEGAHCYNFNKGSIGICLTGNFDTEKPNVYQLKQLRGVLAALMHEYKLSMKDIYLHRDLAKTACPGKNFNKSLI